MAEKPSFWDNPQSAQKLMRERSQLETSFENITVIESDLADALELIELAELDEDDELLKDAETSLKSLEQKSRDAELLALMSGEVDGNDCFL